MLKQKPNGIFNWENDMKSIKYVLLTVVMVLFAQSSISRTADNVMPHGKLIAYYENGLLKSEKYYKYGTPVGTWKLWHENGKLHSKVTFLDTTGQIGKLESRYPSGKLLFKGEAKINNKIKERKEENMLISFDKNCRAVASKKGDGHQWYSNYELEFYSFYENGVCEEAVIETMSKRFAQMYIRFIDADTGNEYDFPWHKAWDSVPKFLDRDDILNCAADAITIHSIAKGIATNNKNKEVLGVTKNREAIWKSKALNYLISNGMTEDESDREFKQVIKKSFDKHVKTFKDNKDLQLIENLFSRLKYCQDTYLEEKSE